MVWEFLRWACLFSYFDIVNEGDRLCSGDDGFDCKGRRRVRLGYVSCALVTLRSRNFWRLHGVAPLCLRLRDGNGDES